MINEQHTLIPDQVRALNDKFGEGKWERLDVPAEGWSAAEQYIVQAEHKFDVLVFASPVPLLLMIAARMKPENTFVFHNDRREKKELPNGKIISTVAAEGWAIF
ncbi:MAG TPA: hypothetical protein VF828_01055 [Patescibacteria group bacterium]